MKFTIRFSLNDAYVNICNFQFGVWMISGFAGRSYAERLSVAEFIPWVGMLQLTYVPPGACTAGLES